MTEDQQNKLRKGAVPQAAPARKNCPACGLEVEAGVTSCPRDGTNLVNALEEEPEFKDRYEFLGMIGSGGMGVIYKARQIILNKNVAIKMLHPHMVSSEAFRRFQIEGQAVSRLQHPYIINIHDLDTTESGQPYMVMDFVEGRTLAQVIERDGPLAMNRFLRIFDQICDALAHAHKRGVLHRDLKPSNIMLTRQEGQEEVRIMDFGIAKLIDAAADQPGSSQLTKTGETIGSPYYMSPEQTRGAKTDNRSDLYSLGCVMYEALTGAPPFSGSTPIETLMMHLNEKPLSLSQSVLSKNEFDPDLEAMIARLLEKNPDLRYQSMEELQSALGRLQSGKPLDRFVDSASAPVRRINWTLVSIALAVSAVVVVVVAAYFLTKKSAPTPTPVVIDHSVAPIPPEVRQSTKAIIADLVRKQADRIYLCDIPRAYDQIQNDDIEPLKEATNTSDIILKGANIDDRGLEHISQLKLQNLDLTETAVKDLHALKNMTTLKTLDLERTHLNDQGMKVLAHLTNLKELNISQTGIIDADLVYLSGLQKLRKLFFLNCSHLTRNGLARLQNKIPACIFVPSLSLLPQEGTKVESNPLADQASSLRKLKKFPEAAAKFAEAAKELRKEVPVNMWQIARCLKSQGQCLVSYGKENIGVHQKEAQQAFAAALKCFDEAQQTFDKIAPTDAAADKDKRHELCEIYALQGWMLEAAPDLRKAVIVREKAVRLVDDHSSDDPTFTVDTVMIDNLVLLGIDLKILNQYDRAIPLFKKAMLRYEQVGKTDTLEYALPACNLGDIYCQRQHFKEALPLYELSIKIIKTHPSTWKNKAQPLMWTAAVTYARLGRNANAELLLKELLDYRPDHQEVYELLIQVLTAEHNQNETALYEKKLSVLKSKAHTP